MPSLENMFRRWVLDRPDQDGLSADSVFVIGLGRFGAAVASELTRLGVKVLAIDNDQALVDEWAGQLEQVRLADGTNSTTLAQLGVTQFDAAVVGIGTGIEASILSTAALVDLGVKNVWAKAITVEHGRILERVGANQVVFPEREMGERVAHVVTGRVIDYFQIDEGFVVAELAVPSSLAGTSLAESGIRPTYSVTVVCIKPIGQNYTYATADSVLGPEDVLLVAGEVKNVARFSDFAAQ